MAYSVWEIATDPEFENVIQQFNQDELNYAFNDAGTFYVRYRVANEAGTCGACGDTYIIKVIDSVTLPGDVNSDHHVDIAKRHVVGNLQRGCPKSRGIWRLLRLG